MAYSTHTITDFTFSNSATDPSKSFVIENGTVQADPGRRGTFHIDARDSCGQPRRRGGETWKVTLDRVAGDDDSGGAGGAVRVDGTGIVDKGDGTYLVSFVAPVGGTYSVGGALVGAGGSVGMSNMLGTVDVSKSLTRR